MEYVVVPAYYRYYFGKDFFATFGFELQCLLEAKNGSSESIKGVYKKFGANAVVELGFGPVGVRYRKGLWQMFKDDLTEGVIESAKMNSIGFYILF